MNIKDNISIEWNDFTTKTNEKICENFDIEYFYNLNEKQKLYKPRIIKQNANKKQSIKEIANMYYATKNDSMNSMRLKNTKLHNVQKEIEKLQKQIKTNEKLINNNKQKIKHIESKIKWTYIILIIVCLINTSFMVYSLFEMYTSTKYSFRLYYYPSFLYVQFLIYHILKCRIIGFDNYEMKKTFNFNIYYYNFLILICSIWGLVVHIETSHLIFFSCFLSFTWLTNIFCKFYISSKKYKLDKFIKKFILLEILKCTDLNIKQYIQERFNILNEFCSMFKKRFNKSLKQEGRSRKDKYWITKTWQIMFCNINRELNLLKNQYKFN